MEIQTGTSSLVKRFTNRPSLKAELRALAVSLSHSHLNKSPRSEFLPESVIYENREKLCYYFYEISGRGFEFLSSTEVLLSNQFSLCLKGQSSFFAKDFRDVLIDAIYHHYKEDIFCYLDDVYEDVRLSLWDDLR